jgi:hypothetical protein
VDPLRLEALFALARDEGLSKKTLEKLLVAAFGMPKNRAYEIAHRGGA